MSATNEGPNPGLAQYAFSVSDLPRTAQLYTQVLGFVKSDGLLLWGNLLGNIQGIPDPGAVLWWAIDRQDYVQLELWDYSRPTPRAKPLDWRPSDIGYNRISVHVADFDGTLASLAGFGVPPVAPPLGPAGDRRVCVRDQDGFLIELMERDPLPDAREPRWPQASSAIRSVSLSVADIGKSRAFWIETLGLEEVDAALLHSHEMEALWDLAGAKSKRILVRAGDGLLEIQQYSEPMPRPRPDGYLLSDIGILNVALGYRDREPFQAAFDRLVANGYKANVQPNPEGPFTSVYVNDDQGFSLEMFYCDQSLDEYLGFTPERSWGS
ncbi:MAG TPA: VOC family protein [Dehalococcoidia bacterium]|nr:VOC family protein [Dehalococcoidia bacterium]